MGDSGASPTVGGRRLPEEGWEGELSTMQLNMMGTIPKATRLAGHIHTVKLFHPPEQGV